MQPKKTVLITEASKGPGLEVAKFFARSGHKVVFLSHHTISAEDALKEIKEVAPESNVIYDHVDLADLDSVETFASKFVTEHDELSILINNAEITYLDHREESVQKHELMFAYNYLSHFVLTAKLFPLMLKTPESRIVFESSLETKKGVLDFFDLEALQFYDSHKAYAQSKLALLIFARELDRRLKETHLPIKSIPVHTGGFHTPLLSRFLNFARGQAPKQAAAPLIFAATSSEALSGHYYGLEGVHKVWGTPVDVDFTSEASNVLIAERLWDISESMSGIEFSIHDMSNVISLVEMKGTRPELHP
jgi:NAD(P)-dependent dehydrogenase (short-subunit alcohol dehydrogenase family)